MLMEYMGATVKPQTMSVSMELLPQRDADFMHVRK
jgi:hypothetical protein